MERFLQLYQSDIVGVLEGFDRLLFRGIQRSICFPGGLEKFLVNQGVWLKNFGPFATRLTKRIRKHAEQMAKRLGRPFRYVASAGHDKDQIVRDILEKCPVKEGLIAVLSCLEPCTAFDVRLNGHWLELYLRPRKCLHLYFYYLDREFGLMHVRLQTWLPFPIQVCINGREYLARQLTREGIGFEQRDNSFSRIDNLPRAQQLLDRLQTRSWVGVLNRFARAVMPWLRRRRMPAPHGTSDRLRPYYWTARQSEYASDIMFRDAARLRETYPQLVRHALQHFVSGDVLRFLGRRGNSPFHGEATTDYKARPEGVRIKHRVNENSIKMYDKHGCILRIETTINQPNRFRVRRLMTRGKQRRWTWMPLRKGVVDLPRRTDLSRAANHRYLEALAGVQLSAPVHRLLDPVSRSIVRAGRPYRGLRPVMPEEARLYAALLDGRFTLQGFRNQDIRQVLMPQGAADVKTRRRLSGQASRWLRLLRAHGLIRKVGSQRYYRLTPNGIAVMSTAQKLRETDTQKLAA